MDAGKIDYSPARRPLKDRVRFKIPCYVSHLLQKETSWTYVTLGGDQLIDIQRLLYALDPQQYPQEIISVYYDPEEDANHASESIRTAGFMANKIQAQYNLRSAPRIIYGTVERLRQSDINSDVVVMFLDYEGTVHTYRHEIGTCIGNNVLNVGDLLFVTSCVDEKFFEGNVAFRSKSQRRVSEYCHVSPEKLSPRDRLGFWDLSLIRDQVRQASFHLRNRLDCKPLGPLVLYENTVRMLWLPLQIVDYDPKSKPPRVRLQTLERKPDRLTLE
jgi:hypothetical protein